MSMDNDRNRDTAYEARRIAPANVRPPLPHTPLGFDNLLFEITSHGLVPYAIFNSSICLSISNRVVSLCGQQFILVQNGFPGYSVERIEG